MKIDYWSKSIEEVPMVNLLTVVASSDAFVEEAAIAGNNSLDWNTIALFAFMLISAVFFTFLVGALIRILWLIKVSPREKWQKIYFVFTQAEGTPFSFFRYIFWNERIDVTTKEGNHVLQHELTHVHEKHSIDKLLMNIVLVMGWFNPFFWLIRKELNMIHEFIADEKAISHGDTATFATVLLKASFSHSSSILANSFFHSPIKRRLVMLTTSQPLRYSYLRRLMLLPLLSILCILFAFKIKEGNSKKEIALLKKTYTVVIDAGHGGNDNGAMSATGLKEKDIDLQLANLVKELNTNDNINILLSRESDKSLRPADRVKFAEENKADLFISIHVNATGGESSKASDKHGAEIYVSNKNELFLKESQVLGSLLSKDVENTFNAVAPIVRRQNNGIQVLDANKTCPAILFHCGFITNAKDVAIISDAEKQKDIANGILKAISFYFQNKEQTGKVETLMEESSKVAKDEMHAKNEGSNIKRQVKQLTNTSAQIQEEAIDKKNKDAAVLENEEPAEFHGGLEGWRRYFYRNTDFDALAKQKAPVGKHTVIVAFIISKDGSISNIEAETKTGYGTEEEAIRTISKGAKWQPAKKDGVFVDTPVKQTITYTVTTAGWSYVELNSIIVGNVETTYVTS